MRPWDRFRHTASRIAATLLATGALPAVSAQAGVVQEVTARFGGIAPSTQMVFAPTGIAIPGDIAASVGLPSGADGYFAAASAGVFGNIGLSAFTTFAPSGSAVSAEVIVGSDDVVNLLAVPQRVTSSFVIDGGFLRDDFSTSTTAVIDIEIGATNLGPVGQETDAFSLRVQSAITAGFGSSGNLEPEYLGGGYEVRYETDATGAASISFSFEGGLDLGATVDPITGDIEIPFSFQTLDFGVLQPGDRLLIGYQATISIFKDGVAEGVIAGFSDPFNLGANSILGGITLTPLSQPPTAVPVPGSLPLLAAGLVLLAARRRSPSMQRA